MLSYDLCQLLSTPCRTCAVSKKIDMERYLKSSDAVGLWYIILICGIRFVRLSVLGDCLISESSGSVGRCGSIHDTGLDASAHGRDASILALGRAHALRPLPTASHTPPTRTELGRESMPRAPGVRRVRDS